MQKHNFSLWCLPVVPSLLSKVFVINVGMAVLCCLDARMLVKVGHFGGPLCFTWMSYQVQNFQRKRLGTLDIIY